MEKKSAQNFKVNSNANEEKQTKQGANKTAQLRTMSRVRGYGVQNGGAKKIKEKNQMLEKVESDRVEKILKREHVSNKLDTKTQSKKVGKMSGSRGLFINSNYDRPVSDVIFCNLIALSAITLSLFLPFVNFALPVLVFFYFEVGVARYLLRKECEENCHYEQLFIPINKYVKIFCLSIVRMFMIAFGLLLFVVPGVICFLNYSFSPFILAENDELDVKGVLMLSKELVFGFRWKIFLVCLLGGLAVGAGATLMFLIVLLFDIFLVVPVFIYVICVLFAVGLALLVLALPMVQLALTDCYLLAKQRKIRVVGEN